MLDKIVKINNTEHKVMLASKYDEHYWKGKNFIIQEKLDGIRATIIRNGKEVIILSRQGKDITDAFPEIKEEALNIIVRDKILTSFVLDGELMPVNYEILGNKESFKYMSMRKRKSGENTGVCFAAYDYVPYNDWFDGKCDLNYIQRQNKLVEISSSCKYIKPVENICESNDPFDIEYTFNKIIVGKNKEGLIIKNACGLYKWGRSNDVQKVKQFKDMDVVINDIHEGLGRHVGRTGAIDFIYKGNIVRVGSGLDDELREEMWNNKENYIGKIAEISYFEESVDKDGNYSLRMPVFKTLKDE